jgi:hypothetical protein
MSAERFIVNERAKSPYSPTTRRSKSKTSILQSTVPGELAINRILSAGAAPMPDLGGSSYVRSIVVRIKRPQGARSS